MARVVFGLFVAAFALGEFAQLRHLSRGARRGHRPVPGPATPGYTGLLFALTGCGLMLGNWAAAVGVFTLVLVALVYRIHREENALLATCGDRYRAFTAARSRLIPRLW